MASVTVNAPKTPVTDGSTGIATATLPNVCKMPGPPAPFVPTPLPNIGKSGDSPKGYSTSVEIEGSKVAIRGATFGSMGDMASKATGGGIVSMNTHGPTSFVGPGALDVKIEGKNVQLLSDPMLNNNGPSGSPPNSATMLGVLQAPGGLFIMVENKEDCPLCGKKHKPLAESEATRADATQVAKALRKQLDDLQQARIAATAKGTRKPSAPHLATMIAVVLCECGAKHNYTDHSNQTLDEFCKGVGTLGANWHHPKGKHPSVMEVSKTLSAAEEAAARKTVRNQFFRRGSDRFEKWKFPLKWAEAERKSLESLERTTGQPNYPPGSCGAPKAILLVIDAGAYPAALSEQWFHTDTRPGKGATKREVFYREGFSESQDPVGRKFLPGESVPPCGTCEILLPLLLCPGNKEPACQGH